MRGRIIIILLLFTCLIFSERVVTLQEVIDAALENNDDMIAAEYQLKSTSWDKYAALTSFLPTASFSSSFLKLDPAPTYKDDFGNDQSLDDKQRDHTIQIVQPITVGGKRLLAYFIARRLEQIAENDFAASELDTRNSAELKFLSLMESFRFTDLAKQDLISTSKNLEITQIKYYTGITSEAELLQMQSEHAAKEAALIDADMYYQISSLDLANFCNFSDRILIPEAISFENPIEKVIDSSDLHKISISLEEYCLKQNLTLKTLERSLNLGKLSRMMTITDNLPSINLIYERSWTDDFDFDEEKDKSSSLMLSASIPILPFVDTFCNYKKENYQYKKLLREYSSAQKGFKLQISSAVLSLASSIKKLKSSELALQYAAKTLLQMEERYRNNLVSANDLLSISIMKQSSEIAVLQNQINLIKYKTELKKLLNLKTDEELLKLIINI
jgi:outer membrane protein TolC